ncbi:hypothetical protein [Actinomadura welshii]|uniref:hypothetical protein n=1 Tax=Actinomadura welshii TaxID=3103817 RepID=UPI0003AD5CC9|nr:hypothetical protein [Actinomadura madurae]
MPGPPVKTHAPPSDERKRIEAARFVRRGASFSLSLPFDENGPQNGWRRRVNPVHTMMSTGQDTAERLGLPHGLTAADDAVFMPLQCRTNGTGSATSSTTASPGTCAGALTW